MEVFWSCDTGTARGRVVENEVKRQEEEVASGWHSQGYSVTSGCWSWKKKHKLLLGSCCNSSSREQEKGGRKKGPMWGLFFTATPWEPPLGQTGRHGVAGVAGWRGGGAAGWQGSGVG